MAAVAAVVTVVHGHLGKGKDDRTFAEKITSEGDTAAQTHKTHATSEIETIIYYDNLGRGVMLTPVVKTKE